MSRLISRDPFARTELRRMNWTVRSDQTCTECGAAARDGSQGRLYLFQYVTESDGGRKFPHRGLFCSKSCHDSYHG